MIGIDAYLGLYLNYLQLGYETVAVNIDRVCGHEEVQALSVMAGEQAIRYHRERLCADCTEENARQYQAKQDRASERAAAAGLPELKGISEAQVQYALVCRDKVLVNMGNDPVVQFALTSVIHASWWIDNRMRTRYLKVFRELEQQSRNAAHLLT